MKKGLLSIAALVALHQYANAQDKIKDGTVSGTSSTPNASAILDLESSNKGLLLPRVSLTSTSTWGLANSTTVNGMIVYNTNTSITSSNTTYPIITGGIGVYYWDGTGWVAAKNPYVEPWNNVSTLAGATANTQNIYQMGNVGIGTNAPAQQLHVNTTGNGTNMIPFYITAPNMVSGSQVYMKFGLGDNGSAMAADIKYSYRANADSNYIGFGFSGGNAKLAVMSNGNVGIGNTTPTNALQISANSDPLRLGGLQTVTSYSSVLAADANGVVKSVDPSAFQEPWYNVATNTGANSNTQNIYQMGKVGIGTTSPAQVFHVNTTSSGTNNIPVFITAPSMNVGDNTYIKFGKADDGTSGLADIRYTYRNSTDSSYVGLGLSGAAPKINVLGNGNIGIATSTPNAKLEIATGNLNIGATDNTFASTTNNSLALGSSNSLGTVTAVLAAGTSNTISNNNSAAIGQSNTVSSPNSVAIGYANTAAGGSSGFGAVAMGYQSKSEAAYSLSAGWGANATNQSEVAVGQWNLPITNSVFSIGTGNLQSNRRNLFIAYRGTATDGSTDWVAIGSGSNTIAQVASEKLRVWGSIRAASNTYADYVFDKYFDGTSKLNPSYKFTSNLYDVEEYVKKNRHLPGVTPISETEKQSDGKYSFDMTDLAVQSLEKIEELYLHTIEQQKTIDSQSKTIENLENSLKALNDRLNKLENK